MFDKQYRFTGSHAKMVNDLTAVIEPEKNTKLFDRNLDVYLNAPLVGFLYKRKGVKNSDNSISSQSIFADQMFANAERMKYIFRIILILDKDYEPELDKRLDKAFRHFGDNAEDLELYDQYVLGGVEVLYEKLIEGSIRPLDYVMKLYDFIEEFNERFNENINNKDVLKLCINNSGND